MVADAKVPSVAVITIESSDDEEDETVLSDEQRCGLDAFQSIFPQVSVREARFRLGRAGWDVALAIDHSLGEHTGADSCERELQEQREVPETKGQAFGRDNATILPGCGPKCIISRLFQEETGKDRNFRASDGEGQLCDQWSSICRRLNGDVFCDPEFPPTTSSIDGRRRSATTENGRTAPVRCLCGYLATPKQVQSDGPNFGRFYLVCGKKQTVRREKSALKEESRKTDNSTSAASAAALKNPYIATNTSQATPKLPDSHKCKFFQWDSTGSKGASGYSATLVTKLAWRNLGVEPRFVLCRNIFASSHIRQGAVGNCWFLSALAVVAERNELIRRIMPHTSTNTSGCYQVNLFLDGAWEPVIVDSNLPIVIQKRGKAAKDESFRGGTNLDETTVAVPAFCAAPEYQLWAPLVEKAYAKAHGSYQMLSGGFIQEGLQDLTGAPTETVVFRSTHFDKETFWGRLLSFSSAGFLMGVATAGGGDGLVGSHAYSVLDIIDLHDCVIGEQSKLTDFFGKKRKKIERTSVRLVRIRNPWGRKEWKGEWSVTSERWTKKLRARLSNHQPFAKDDGTFFMSYDDMLQRFHHMDIAMTQKNWVNSIAPGYFRFACDPIRCSASAYMLSVPSTTSAIVSIIQPKKRANTKTSSWYCDPCLVICSRESDGTLTKESVIVSGTTRQIHTEITLQEGKEYMCLPFSCLTKVQEIAFQFRLTLYSSVPVSIIDTPSPDSTNSDSILRILHQELLSKPVKYTYPLGGMGKLVCIHGRGCLYFVACNGHRDSVVSVKITLHLPNGLLALMEQSEFDIPPSTEAICCVVATNGRQSTATQFSFRYMASISQCTAAAGHPPRRSPPGLCTAISLTMAGDLLISSENETTGDPFSGGGVIETHHWIPQLGQANFA